MNSKQVTSSGFVTGGPESIMEQYVDGVSSSIIGSPVSKITFHSVKELREDGNEVRIPNLRLVIPTGPLVELCRSILAIASANSDGLQAGYGQNASQIASLLKDIQVPPYPTPQSEPS